MKQATTIALIYTVLIFVLVGLLFWFVADHYRVYFQPIPLQNVLVQPSSSSSPSPVSAVRSAQIDPTTKAMIPFNTIVLEEGHRIGTVTITLSDIFRTFGNLAFNTSSDISDLAMWRQAAAQLSRDAIILDEAVQRGYQLPAEDVFATENVASATFFLKSNLEATSPTVTIDSLVSKRIDEFLTLQAKTE